MIKITTEDIISSLLALRFQKIDKYLYLLTLSKLTIPREDECLFEFIKDDYSDFFNTYIERDGLNFKLKEGYRLSSDTSNGITIYSKLKNKNRSLTDYLETLDFKDIIMNKINMLSTSSAKVSDYSNLFCDKEREIISEIFGIKEMHKKNIKESSNIIAYMYEQENKDIDNALETLKRIREKK